MINRIYNAPRIVSKFLTSKKRIKFIKGPIGCLSADSEFLSGSGWVRMDQYKRGMMVAQWAEDGSMSFVLPENYIDEPCDEFISFSNKHNLSMVLSEEHRLPLYKFDGAFCVKTALQVEKKPSRHTIPVNFTVPFRDAPVSDDVIRLAVAMNADGCRPKAGHRVVFGFRKERKKTRLRELLANLGIDYSENTLKNRPTETTFSFESPYEQKDYSGWYWWQLSTRQLAIVVEEMSHWDGLFEGPDTRFHSNRKIDADYIQYAVHATGGKANICVKTYPQPNWDDTYIVHIATEGSRKAKVMLRVDGTDIQRVPSQDGRKYCFTVPTGFFVARHNDRIFVTGNSGKSVGCVMRIIGACKNQIKGPDGFRRSRWVIVRNTRQQLKDTTLKTWFDWVPPGIAGKWKESEMTFFLEFGDVKAEILFRALDSPEDVRKVLSLELTGAWLNEAREIPREIVEGVDGRLKRYPSQAMGGSNYWDLIADTNPPEVESYWYNMLEHLPTEEGNPDSVVDCDAFHQPSGISAGADNAENLEPTYYSDLAKGKTAEWISVNIHANYAQSQSGKPIYQKSFKSQHHVSRIPLIIDPNLPIVVGMDFGRTPAAVFKQMQPDGRVFNLRTIAEFDMDVKTFMKRRFTPMVKTTFPTNPIIVIGDPSGIRQSENDSGTCFKEIKKAGYKAKAASTNDPVVRINATEKYLLDFPGGEPVYLICPHQSNKFLIDALRSKYRYDKKRTSIGGAYHTSPSKNDWSHTAEANQYGDMFLSSGRYDAADFVRFDDNGIFHVQAPTGPADTYAGY